MTLAFLGLLVWLLIGLALGVMVGQAIARADAREVYKAADTIRRHPSTYGLSEAEVQRRINELERRWVS